MVSISRSNVIANYLGAAVVGLAPVLALPRFRAALGDTEFGLLTIVLLLQSLVSILDVGASQSLVRVVANMGPGSMERVGTMAHPILRRAERAYWAVGLVFAVAMLAVHPFLAQYWFHLEVHLTQIRWTLCGAGLLVLCQFPGLFYRSLLIGAEQQVKLNQIMATAAVCRHGGAVVLVAWDPKLENYVLWNAVILALETLWRRSVAWRYIPAIPEVETDADARNGGKLSQFNREVLLMSLAAWMGAVTTQTDRLMVSWLASVEDLGRYTLASYVSVGVLQLLYPVIQAVWPGAVRSSGDAEATRRLQKRLYQLIFLAIGIIALVYAVAGHWLLGLWLHGTGLVNAVEPIVNVLLVGTALNALYNVGYLNWLAHGAAQTILRVNLLSFMVVIVVTPFAIQRWGAAGAALGWVCSAAVGLLCSLFLTVPKRQQGHV